MNIHDTLTGARVLEDQFADVVWSLDSNIRGARPSDMLFLNASVKEIAPRRFIETHTAEGQNTLQLALCYPDAKVISFDTAPELTRAEIARDRVADVENIELRYGDPVENIPIMLLTGDVVFIDQPKGFEAVQFALDLLATDKPSCVFINGVDADERRFIERFIPQAYFSDNEVFAEKYGYLNTLNRGPSHSARRLGLEESPLDASSTTKPTLCCIPRDCDVKSFKWLSLQRRAWEGWSNLRESLPLPS